ncbi:hypothetical protein [Streptomyces sp. NBC_01176]|uniref:hypothetical protein n=1 Tax=Streptomyces sp. NBC_01176 TaxID=2903760 RepID=UPI002F90946C|nr:hypothetical protein OG199_44625 [Streptomyces sp. NBC_01176]
MALPSADGIAAHPPLPESAPARPGTVYGGDLSASRSLPAPVPAVSGPAGARGPQAEGSSTGSDLTPPAPRAAAAAPGNEESEAEAEQGLRGMLSAPGRATGPRAGRAPAGHRTGKPFLMAAAFAGAVLASVPLISHHGGRTSYEGLGRQVPIASETPGAADDGTATVTDGTPSLEPLRDPAQGTAGPVLPQVAPSPAAEGDDTHGAVPTPAPAAGPRIVHKTSDGAAPRPAPAASGTHGKHAGLLRPSAGKAAAHASGASGAGLGLLTGAGNTASATQRTGERKPSAHSGTAAVSAAGKPTTTAARTSGTATTRATPAKAGTTTAGPAATPVRATARAMPATTKREWSTRVVSATTVLGPGESVASDRMKVTMRTDGNLVITDENGTVRWSSHTGGTGYKAVFQDDGHLVVYTQANGTAWSSGTAGNPGAQLVIQADGNVVIQSAGHAVLWSAGTQH